MLSRIRYAAGPAGVPCALTADPFDLGAEDKPEAPTAFRVFKFGANTSDKGTFIFDEKAAESVMLAFAKKETPLTMDYEHQAAQDPPIEAPASAYSWVPEIRKGELWATNVKWTARAKGLIESREYTRFSPLFLSDPKTKRVVKIINCALTNTEALDGVTTLVPVAATATTTTGADPMKTMKCSVASCLKALKAPTDTDDGDAVSCSHHTLSATGLSAVALTAIGMKSSLSEAEQITQLGALTSLRAGVLAITGKSEPLEALAVITAWKANEAELVKLNTRIAEIESVGLRAQLETIVKDAVEGGKVAPMDRSIPKITDDLVAGYMTFTGGKITDKVVTALKADLDGRQKIAGVAPTKQAEGGATALTAEEITMADQMSIPHDDMRAHKAKAVTAQAAAAAK